MAEDPHQGNDDRNPTQYIDTRVTMLVTLVVHADHESNVISANTNEDVMQSFKTAQLVSGDIFLR